MIQTKAAVAQGDGQSREDQKDVKNGLIAGDNELTDKVNFDDTVTSKVIFHTVEPGRMHCNIAKKYFDGFE